MIVALAAVSGWVDATGQAIPDTPRWSVSSVAPPAGAPVIAGSMIVVPLHGEAIAAHHLTDGRKVWTIELAAQKPLAGDAERVYVPATDAIHAVDAETGVVTWRTPIGGAPTAPPLAHAGWIIVAAVGEVLALRATDGQVIWRQALGAVEFRPAIEGDLLVVSLIDGYVVGLDVQSGAVRWKRDLGSSPTEPFVIAGRVYLGTRDKFFYTLHADSGRREDGGRYVGAVIMGRPTADEHRLYFAALDNVLWAVDRRHGAVKWRAGLGYRPAAGPVVLGSHVVVPGPAESLPAFDVKAGTSTRTIPFSGRLVSLPLLNQPIEGFAFAVGITGNLENKFTISLLEPSPVPSVVLDPLKALPGETMPLPAVPSIPLTDR